jgi:hypothetical protein
LVQIFELASNAFKLSNKIVLCKVIENMILRFVDQDCVMSSAKVKTGRSRLALAAASEKIRTASIPNSLPYAVTKHIVLTDRDRSPTTIELIGDSITRMQNWLPGFAENNSNKGPG